MKNLLTIVFVIIISNLFSQNDTLNKQFNSSIVKLFIDCDICDLDYIKEEMSFVSYVRDPKVANIQIIINDQNTGNGGKEYSLFFIGLDGFEFLNDIQKFTSNPDDTEAEIREGLLKVMKLGLMRYLARTPLAEKFEITYKTEDTVKDSIIDKWRNWVFNINLNGYFNGEESYSSYYYNGNISIGKVTEKQKLNFNYYYNQNIRKFIVDGDTILGSTFSEDFSNLYVKSINKHWSAGSIIDIFSSTYRNIRIKALLAPAVEYNLFPYSESNSRQLRFLYSFRYSYSQYYDSTIYNKIEESLLSQNLEIALKVKRKWGSVSTAVSASNYFHDFSKNSLNLWTELSVRLFKGFSVTLSGSTSLINDQLFLPKTEPTYEEMLLQLRQSKTGYSYYISAGISYTFGSIYSNIVNPRFGE